MMLLRLLGAGVVIFVICVVVVAVLSAIFDAVEALIDYLTEE